MDAWAQKKAGELVTFRTGKLDSNAAEEDGKYPFFTCAQQTYRINRYGFDTECALLAGNNAAGVFPLKYFSGKFNAYQRTYVIEPKDRKELSTKYFYYYLRPLLKAFEQQATGVTTKFLTLKILISFVVQFPQFDEQRKIAAILTAYDDLIETNRRRIALLEKMAEELYREWFVRMRFPGHQNIELELTPLREFVEAYIGGDWGNEVKSPKFQNRVYVIRGTDFKNVTLGDTSRVPERFIKGSSLRSRKLQPGDLIVENSVNHKSRTAGKTLLVT